MKPFEVLGSDRAIYLHHDNWYRWRDETLSVHPGEGKWRFDLDLRYPRDTLEEVPVTNQRVHRHGGYTPHTCFYECDDWSTIYDFYESSNEPMFRMIVESQNPQPHWGEPITLLSTSTYFKCEPWGHNVPNQFAFFRGQYWQVNYSELLHHEFPAGVGYPLRDGHEGFGVPRRGGEINPLMGYRGTEFIDAGYFYAPYIPLYQTGFVPSKEFMEIEMEIDWKKFGF
jgi:hypothetical protein